MTAFASRADFDDVLARTERDVAASLDADPTSPLWPALAQQLAAMRRWSEAGRSPTALERRRISVGVLASRELEPPASLAHHDLAQRLYELQHHFQQRL